MKLLVLLSRFPYPLDKGDKLRAFHQLRHLARRFEVCLFALTDEDVTPEAHAAVAPLCAGGVHVHRLRKPGIGLNMGLGVLKGWPFQVGYFYDAAAARQLAAVVQQFAPERLYCQLIRMAEYARPYAAQLPMTLDYMDVFSTGMTRRAAKAPVWQRPVFALEAHRLQQYEAECFAWFRHHTIISDQDRQLIDHEDRQRIQVVPNGIDTEHFRPGATPADEPYELVFCGNMAYHPNVEAAEWLAQEILPAVHQQHPQARLLLAGTTPAARVLALRSAHVQVSGWLPDIRTAYASARVFVAPMRTGTGLQNKLLEAMAMGRPSVTTPLANNALHATAGQHVLVGRTTEELAAHVRHLLEKPTEAAGLGANGREFVREQYNWEASTERLADLLRL
ncbi:glycosyltransferase [Hymenobacter busanensis]|uniref:Glycosyltransferase n=1 Tax=Hymenobacter busanensis TaxID=2607656 RepID=A0A7L4ZUP7_9BACT|nr:glycosyltransferase [Hymenobacter busanensis]KAA9339710.1 glycosyltransferase [Hymenobacter busanensis]QHJ06535.1 glycosyltransferase [Hymenobacter busanensis]